MSQVIDVQTPVYNILARYRDGSCHTLFVLATEDIGHRQKASVMAVEAMAKIIKVDPHCIANPEGEISLLIGLENTELLLREVYYINGVVVEKPSFTKDIMPSTS